MGDPRSERVATAFGTRLARRSALVGLGAGGLASAAAALLPDMALAQATPDAAGDDPAAPFLKAWAAAWSAHDAVRLAALFATDVVFEDLAFGLVARGREEMQSVLEGFFQAVPDLDLPLRRGFSAGDRVAAEWGFAGTDRGGLVPGVPATGNRFDVRGASLFELRDGLIWRETDFYNLATILRQLGIQTVPGNSSGAGTPTS